MIIKNSKDLIILGNFLSGIIHYKQKKLFAGDSNLNQIEELIFPIIKVLRDETSGTFEFSYSDNLVLISNHETVYQVPLVEFHRNAVLLLQKLKEKTDAAFSIPEIEQFINSFGNQSLKAKSTVKSDIRIVIHDQRTGNQPELGFSIKSKLGGAATLLNAGKTTNFIFKITNIELDAATIETINSIDSRSKIKNRIESIIQKAGNLEFIKTDNPTFGNNLMLIDSAMANIIAEALLIFYRSALNKTNDLVEQIIIQNPLDYDLSSEHPFYVYKFKRFLTDIALGMTPSKVWTGKIDATGGYLIVKESGDIVCYHIYNRNEFEDYLFSNTKFETASSSRHEFGKIYEENGDQFFKLNLQIRFL